MWVYVERKDEKHGACKRITGIGACQLGEGGSRLTWFEHIERKSYGDWVKLCMSMGIEGTRWRRHLRSTQ